MKKKPTKHSGTQLGTASRSIPTSQQFILCGLAGGRCEFDGCNKFLFEEPTRHLRGNFAQKAHIYAFSDDGPRGKSRGRPSHIHDVDNLMLVCNEHHVLIDRKPDEFPVETLLKYKSAHEKRIRFLSELSTDLKTLPVVVVSPIARQQVAIPYAHILSAVAPHYPIDRDPVKIDLSQISDSGDTFLATACDAIRDQLAPMVRPGGRFAAVGHVSIFALAPIPLLVFLGTQLTNKVPTDLFQRHRGPEDWAWKTPSRKKPLSYSIRRLAKGAGKVSLVVSLSGKIPFASLPQANRKGTVYEISVSSGKPSPSVLRTKSDLERFRIAYLDALARINKEKGLIEKLDLFPAVPAPVAILLGRELLPKVHPRLEVFDYDKQREGFTYQLGVNKHGN